MTNLFLMPVERALPDSCYSIINHANGELVVVDIRRVFPEYSSETSNFIYQLMDFKDAGRCVLTRDLSVSLNSDDWKNLKEDAKHSLVFGYANSCIINSKLEAISRDLEEHPKMPIKDLLEKYNAFE